MADTPKAGDVGADFLAGVDEDEGKNVGSECYSTDQEGDPSEMSRGEVSCGDRGLKKLSEGTMQRQVLTHIKVLSEGASKDSQEGMLMPDVRIVRPYIRIGQQGGTIAHTQWLSCLRPAKT